MDGWMNELRDKWKDGGRTETVNGSCKDIRVETDVLDALGWRSVV